MGLGIVKTSWTTVILPPYSSSIILGYLIYRKTFTHSLLTFSYMLLICATDCHIMHKFLWLTVWIIKQYHYKPFFTNGLFVMWILSLFFYRFRHSFLYSIYFLINTKHQVQIIIKISFYLQDSESLSFSTAELLHHHELYQFQFQKVVFQYH